LFLFHNHRNNPIREIQENNKAVKKRYCEPLFRDICDDEERDLCIRGCIQYVSEAQGGCCDIECD